MREGSLVGVWVLYPRGGQAVRDRHFTNVSVDIWVQPLNVNGFLGLLGDLRGILVNYIEIRNQSTSKGGVNIKIHSSSCDLQVSKLCFV